MKPLLLTFLACGLAVLAAKPGLADVGTGKTTFEANKCQDCHSVEKAGAAADIHAHMDTKGPELWYAGSKFQKDWLAKWLVEPTKIRFMLHGMPSMKIGDHAKLSADDAAQVTDYLMSLTSDLVKPGTIKPKKNPKGRLIFTKKMPCSGCHQFPTKKKYDGGRTGPSLVGAGDRLNPDWIYAYLANIDEFKPVRPMPNFVGILSDKDMINVARYVASFKSKK